MVCFLCGPESGCLDAHNSGGTPRLRTRTLNSSKRCYPRHRNPRPELTRMRTSQRRAIRIFPQRCPPERSEGPAVAFREAEQSTTNLHPTMNRVLGRSDELAPAFACVPLTKEVSQGAKGSSAESRDLFFGMPPSYPLQAQNIQLAIFAAMQRPYERREERTQGRTKICLCRCL